MLSIYATFLDLGAALGPLVGLSVGTLGALRWAFVAGAVLLVLIALVYRRVTPSGPPWRAQASPDLELWSRTGD